MDAIYALLDAALGLSAVKPDQLSVAQVCVRAVSVFLILIAYVRIGKKRFLGEATAFDAILVIVIGSLASRAISGTAPFVASLAGTLILILTHWSISWIAARSKLISYWTKGHDTVIIRDGTVDRHALRAAHMSDDDLTEDLRDRGIENPSLAKEARLERSGKLSVIKK
jgi:uncharacterized membrane protein YcaP (DUF421 family)